jgi:hypothetical protein
MNNETVKKKKKSNEVVKLSGYEIKIAKRSYETRDTNVRLSHNCHLSMKIKNL